MYIQTVQTKTHRTHTLRVASKVLGEIFLGNRKAGPCGQILPKDPAPPPCWTVSQALWGMGQT